ncbi:MAG: fibronectin type III domain-containing protein, partial [Gemmatimonadota bacterium]
MIPRSISSAVLVAALGVFTLTACGDDGTTEPTGPTSPPAVPSGISASVSGDTISVSWNPVSGADSYRVQISSDNDERSTTVQAPTTSATFPDVNRGVTYAAQVEAINSAGSSGFSSSVTVTVQAAGSDVRVISNDITSDTTFTADRKWVLDGPVFVGEDCGTSGDCEGAVTLTIEPGATIYGRKNPTQSVRGSYLIVQRGSQIIADANPNDDACTKPSAENVIVFTSDQPAGQRARGDWGGLVINGQAPINSGEEAQGEGDSGLYGGTEPEDDSGILCGVRVEYAGDDVTATDQLNGIAFQGVGAGTTVDYVQVHYNVDDGTEPFGGTVSQTHMVMTGIGDDSFDGTDGYRGFMQFLIAQQRGDDADQGMELSNNGADPDAAPHSTAVAANATLVGAGVDLGSGEIAAKGDASDAGVLLREGSSYRIFNSIVTGFGASGMDVEGARTAAHADNRLNGQTDPASTLRFEGNVLWSNAGQGGGDHNLADESGDGYTQSENLAFFNEDGYRNMLADPQLPDAAFSIGSMDSPPNLVPTGTPSGY